LGEVFTQSNFQDNLIAFKSVSNKTQTLSSTNVICLDILCPEQIKLQVLRSDIYLLAETSTNTG